MRNALVILTALCISSSMIGCNSKSKPVPPVVPQPVQPQPEVKPPVVIPPVVVPIKPIEVVPVPPVAVVTAGWTLKFQSKCAEGVEATECLGFHGLSIQTNGNYQVGPDATSGLTRQGVLTEEEKNAVSAALVSTLAQPTLRAEAHDSIEVASETEDTLTLTRGSAAPSAIVRTGGKDLYYQTLNADEAKALLVAVRKIAEVKAKNFPDGCADGSNALQALISSAQKCAIASDCVYLDSSLDIVAANSSESIVTDNCSKITPLFVGNAESVRVNKVQILKDLETVQGACGNGFIRDNCTEFGAFQLKGTAALCEQGLCKLPAQ